MNTLKKFLFVSRKEVSNKWWHRFACVSIYYSTAIILIASYLYMLPFKNWTEKHLIYKAEYTLDGLGVCKLSTKGCKSHPLIDCKGIKDSNDFLKRTKYNMKQLKNSILMHNSNCELYDIPNDEIFDAAESGLTTVDSNSYLNHLIINSKLDKSITVKEVKYQYEEIAIDLFTPFLLATIWFLFTMALLYRTILYVVYGPKTTESN
jgi:hypothetical protein